VDRISVGLSLDNLETLLSWYECKESNCYNDCHDDELMNIIDLHKRVLLMWKARDDIKLDKTSLL